jgi:hypothetical protein
MIRATTRMTREEVKNEERNLPSEESLILEPLSPSSIGFKSCRQGRAGGGAGWASRQRRVELI